MKTIRQLTGVFILISWVLHAYLFLKAPGDPGSIGILVVAERCNQCKEVLHKSKINWIKVNNYLPLPLNKS